MRSGAVLLALSMAACNSPAQPTLGPDASPTASPIIPTPTATAEPEAARVNGEPILLRTYQAELERYQIAMAELGIELATQDDYQMEVLQRLIERQLLAHAALRLGAQISEAELDLRIEQLTQERGGSQAMEQWLNAVGFTPEGFRDALREEMLAAQMIRTISEGVASDVEQVHARHILVASEEAAQDLLRLLDGGADFEQLARIYSLDGSTRPGGGDLGWFARGTLTVPELEEAAFELQVGQVSGVLQTALGYHLLEVLERDRRPLAGNALMDYRSGAVERWLAEQLQAAAIEVFVGP